jgi:hypothetical protein
VVAELWADAWPADGRGLGAWAQHAAGSAAFAANAWALAGSEATPTAASQEAAPSASAASAAADSELLAVAVGKRTVAGGLPPRAISVVVRGPRTPNDPVRRSSAVAACLASNTWGPPPAVPVPRHGRPPPPPRPWRLADDGLFAARLTEHATAAVAPTARADFSATATSPTAARLVSAAARAAAAPAGLFDGPHVFARALRLDWRRLLASRRFYECFAPPPCAAPPVPRNAVDAKAQQQQQQAILAAAPVGTVSARAALAARAVLAAQLHALEDAVVDHAEVSQQAP